MTTPLEEIEKLLEAAQYAYDQAELELHGAQARMDALNEAYLVLKRLEQHPNPIPTAPTTLTEVQPKNKKGLWYVCLNCGNTKFSDTMPMNIVCQEGCDEPEWHIKGLQINADGSKWVHPEGVEVKDGSGLGVPS